MLVNVLIILFSLLILVQAIHYYSPKFSYIEGLTNGPNSSYIPYDPSDATSPNSANNAALTLAQHNAQNITYLNNQLSELTSLQSEVTDISKNVVVLNQQVQGLVQQQAGYAQGIGNAQNNESKTSSINSAVQQVNAINAQNS
jgi:hypothetical protein